MVRVPSFAPIFLIAVVACACGSDDAPGGNPSGSSASSSGGGSTSSSSGGSSSGSQGVGCTAPSVDSDCSVPDGSGFQVSDAVVVTDASCKTVLYLTAAATTGSDAYPKLRRYTVKSIEPCVLERDAAFPELPARGKLAVDDAGSVYVASGGQNPIGGIQRLVPGETLVCKNPDNVDFTEFNEAAFTVAPDGSVGYASFYDGLKSPAYKLVKLTADATSCSYSLLQPTGVMLDVANGLAIDGRGRIHIADVRLASPPGNDRVVIVDKGGAYVAEYKQLLMGAMTWAPTSISRCHLGICLPTQSDDIVVVRDDGSLVSRGAWVAGSESFDDRLFPSNARAPLFHVDTRQTSPSSIGVTVFRDR